jgi:hypothetical protein
MARVPPILEPRRDTASTVIPNPLDSLHRGRVAAGRAQGIHERDSSDHHHDRHERERRLERTTPATRSKDSTPTPIGIRPFVLGVAQIAQPVVAARGAHLDWCHETRFSTPNLRIDATRSHKDEEICLRQTGVMTAASAVAFSRLSRRLGPTWHGIRVMTPR